VRPGTPGGELVPPDENRGAREGGGGPGPAATPAPTKSTVIAPKNALITGLHRSVRAFDTEKSLGPGLSAAKLVPMPFVDNILQPTHLLLVLVVALLVLGPKRLPEAGRALGKGIRDFRSAMSGDEREPHDQIVTQASNVEAAQPKDSAPPAEPVQPIG
jgi:sec-independent protein translocase protein TatA